MTFDSFYLEKFLELECYRCLMAQQWAVNAQANKKSLTDDSSPVDSAGMIFAGYLSVLLLVVCFILNFRCTVIPSSHNL